MKERLLNASLYRKGVRVLQTLAFSAAASLLPPDPIQTQLGLPQETALAQQLPDEVPLLFPVNPFLNTKVGEVADMESNFPNLQKDNLGQGMTKFAEASSAIGTLRENEVITDSNHIVVFKRALPSDLSVNVSQYRNLYGFPEATVAAPEVYEELFYPAETQVWAKYGFALVVNPQSNSLPAWTWGSVFEIQVFKPSTVEGYTSNWNEGEYNPTGNPLYTRRSVAFFIDGLESRLENQLDRDDVTFGLLRQDLSAQDLFRKYDEISIYSYLGGSLSRRQGQPPIWLPAPYEAKNTHQSIETSARILYETIEQYRRFYARPKIDLVGYSLGGEVLWEYLKNYVLPANGPHRSSVIGYAIFLDAPINGVQEPLLLAFGDEVTQYLASLARDEEAWQNTIAANAGSADFLITKRGVNIWSLGNEDDCLVEPRSSIILNHGTRLSLGRGPNGIKSCDDLVLAFTSPDAITRVGHDQILTDGTPRNIVQSYLLRRA